MSTKIWTLFKTENSVLFVRPAKHLSTVSLDKVEIRIMPLFADKVEITTEIFGKYPSCSVELNVKDTIKLLEESLEKLYKISPHENTKDIHDIAKATEKFESPIPDRSPK